MVLPRSDTIVAAATPRGVSALAVVRLSGPDACAIAGKVFRGADLADVASHTVHVGFARTADGTDIDQVVATVFRAPSTPTGEDIVEFSCHGGSASADAITEQLVRAGARPAGPGEFTERAFVNGKMDLAQAEAVAELIHARSSRAHRVSLSHLKGQYSRVLDELRGELLDLLSLLELELDFSDEDVEFADRARLEALLERGFVLVDELIGSYRFGRAVRDGIVVAIGGKPNAGKSTLLNALVGYERAIVSEVPGTTRDEVEAEVEFDGWRLLFVDTAGLRETVDTVEAEGVRRARHRFAQSDILLYVIDATLPQDEAERVDLERIASDHPDLHVVVVANKMDLWSAGGQQDADGKQDGWDQHGDQGKQGVKDQLGEGSLRSDLQISALKAQTDGSVAESVLRHLVDLVASGSEQVEEHRVVTSERHRDHLRRTKDALGRAIDGMKQGRSADLVAADLRAALDEIGMITGRITNDDVLGQIFSRFCIGK